MSYRREIAFFPQGNGWDAKTVYSQVMADGSVIRYVGYTLHEIENGGIEQIWIKTHTGQRVTEIHPRG